MRSVFWEVGPSGGLPFKKWRVALLALTQSSLPSGPWKDQTDYEDIGTGPGPSEYRTGTDFWQYTVPAIKNGRQNLSKKVGEKHKGSPCGHSKCKCKSTYPTKQCSEPEPLFLWAEA